MDITITQHFKPFLEPHRYKVAYGGRGSGKSWTIAQLLVLKAYSEPVRILCCREIQKSIGDSVLQLLGDTIERLGMLAFFDIQKNQILGKNGSRFIFEGLRSNITKVKSMEGIDIVWAEEAENITATSWDILIPTIRKAGSEIWVSFNPFDEMDETWQRFVVSPPPDTYKIKVNYHDNPWFPDELLQEAQHLERVNHSLYKHIWLGECMANKEGAYYASQINDLDELGRLTSIPIETTLPIHTAWDLGISDSTAIWFYQEVAGEVRIVDYYEQHGEGLNHYIQYLHDWRTRHQCNFGNHHAPHDIKVRELTTGKSRLEIARKMGIHFKVVPQIPLQDGIQATRNFLSKCWFDKDRCQMGIRMLRNYRREYDEVHNVFKKQPLHDFTSHGSDAFRYLAVSHREQRATMRGPVQAGSFDPLAGF